MRPLALLRLILVVLFAITNPLRLFAAVADKLAEVGIAGEDVFIGYVENTAGDWSFGFGRAQYVTGELAVPRK